MKLQDSVIAITGGGQGLGRAMAVSLAAKGARLALIDLNEERLQETVALCEQAGSRHATTFATLHAKLTLRPRSQA